MGSRVQSLLDRWRAALRRREDATADAAHDAPGSTSRLVEAQAEETEAHTAYDEALADEERHWEDEPG